MKKDLSLKEIVGKKLLTGTQNSYLKYLESSAAIYEVNGDYSIALFAPKYCEYLNQTSKNII